MTPSDSAPPAGIQDAARHLAEGRTDEAAALLERIVRDFPAYVTAHVLLAKAREAGGHTGRALEAWHTAYFLMPGSPLVVRERARLLRAASLRPAEAAPSPEYVEPEVDVAEPEVGVAEPQEEGEHPQPDIAAASSAATKPSDAIGGDPEAWTTDGPGEAPPAEPYFAEEEDGLDWAILEETETPHAADDVAEPVIAPPPGHPAPSAPRSAAPPPPETGDLDALIEQLERAPRIRPDPEFHGEDYDAEPDAFGAGEVVSETLAKIYETQKQYADAARAYDQLAVQRPARADELRARAAEMRRRAAEAGQA